MTLSTFLESRRSAIALPTFSADARFAPAFALADDLLLRRRGCGQGPPGIVVDDLRINMLAGKMHGEARTLRRAADAFPDPRVNAVSNFLTIAGGHNY